MVANLSPVSVRSLSRQYGPPPFPPYHPPLRWWSFVGDCSDDYRDRLSLRRRIWVSPDYRSDCLDAERMPTNVPKKFAITRLPDHFFRRSSGIRQEQRGRRVVSVVVVVVEMVVVVRCKDYQMILATMRSYLERRETNFDDEKWWSRYWYCCCCWHVDLAWWWW